MSALIETRGLDLDTPHGRPLVRALSMQLGREQVALVGRNGVGKSSLLRVLAGAERPTRGSVEVRGSVAWVPQDLHEPAERSPGERRRAALSEAFRSGADLLLLDEPTEDLDEGGRQALMAALAGWRGGLVVISHDPELLDQIGAYFVMEEAGCHALTGSVDALIDQLKRQAEQREAAYLRALRTLASEETKDLRVRQRRRRKKAVGRIHELDRNQSRIRLNARRSSAQVSQARVRRIADARRDARRDLVAAMRRSLAVRLPLSGVVPTPEPGGWHVDGLEVRIGDRVVVRDLDLLRPHQRIAVVGPNGAGKTTLLEALAGARPAYAGRVGMDPLTVGFIAQGGTNWTLDESLVAYLARMVDVDGIAHRLAAHRFPLGLAERPLASLSPGERTRAALIALFERPRLSVLVLDEPTRCLDLVGAAALTEALRAWTGGLLVASHDRRFLAQVGVDETLALVAPT